MWHQCTKWVIVKTHDVTTAKHNHVVNGAIPYYVLEMSLFTAWTNVISVIVCVCVCVCVWARVCIMTGIFSYIRISRIIVKYGLVLTYVLCTGAAIYEYMSNEHN